MNREDVVEAARATLDGLKDKDVEDYNPDTCITAGELRAFGYPIPETIPDCGWVRRSSWDVTTGAVSMDDDGTINMDMNMGFCEAFQWIEVTLTVAKEAEDD